MTHTTHNVRFTRNTATGELRAVCTCHWSMTGDREEVQSAAAVHDMDERVLTRVPPFRPGFVSGLPE